MKPLRRRSAFALGALAFLAVFLDVRISGSSRGDFRVDEAYKISETPFLELWMRGDFHHPAWFDFIADRFNPPVGKYAFGAAILSRGQSLPPLPTLGVQNPSIPPLYSEELSAPYRPYLPAARSVSTFSVALTAALLTTILARYHGWLAAVIAFALFVLEEVTRAFWATAVFDPLFALFFMAAIALMVVLAAAPSTRRVVLASIGVGITTALAFQTRLNGIYAFIVAIAFLWITLRHAIRKAVLATLLTTAAFVGTTLLLNPYYWSTPSRPIEPFSSDRGPMRPITRLVQQKKDLEFAASFVQPRRGEGRTPLEKVEYLFVTRDLPGFFLRLSAMLSVVVLLVRRNFVAPPMRIAVLMSLAIVATMVLTLPMPWTRYLFVDLGPLALMAGFTTSEGWRALTRRYTAAP